MLYSPKCYYMVNEPTCFERVYQKGYGVYNHYYIILYFNECQGSFAYYSSKNWEISHSSRSNILKGGCVRRNIQFFAAFTFTDGSDATTTGPDGSTNQRHTEPSSNTSESNRIPAWSSQPPLPSTSLQPASSRASHTTATNHKYGLHATQEAQETERSTDCNRRPRPWCIRSRHWR